MHQHLLRYSVGTIQKLSGIMQGAMLDTTLQAIKAILQADPTVSREERVVLLKNLQMKPTNEQAVGDRVISRAEVAEMLGGKSLRFVDYLAAEGKIRKVRLTGKQRGIGFSYQSVQELILGCSTPEN
jgi:hypothetical protein